ncbi:tRNA-guanine transglycosylase [Halogeometricum borinquense]|uniref:tRNA-guanine transglycosylase n=2 Tax=Halogeometricum borinquense TaxID=60847 RepID=A0A482T011_9EURY|nr:tRNA-guanine transglycosylase [Halogeometricum borinquense]
MFQAMSFLDFHLPPHQVDTWRHEAASLHEWFTGHDSPKDNPSPPPFTQPLFVDSGGFKLMNSKTFGDAPGEGGTENEWGIYTNPDSILELQYDYGADLIATLDYPIPKGLNEAEKYQRIEDSINSAVRCIELLEEADKYADWDPVVYAAIHGHDYEEIAYYVAKLFERTDYPDTIDGFAVGSLVPLRSGNIDTLVDIVQGASDAIPKSRRDDLTLHVFGVGGRLAPLITALGVDSYDSSTYVQAAQHKNFIDPDDSSKVNAIDLPETWDCSCPVCSKELTKVGIDNMKEVLQADRSYKPIAVNRKGTEVEYMKSDFYALIAHHNFHVFQDEIESVREAISEGSLGELITKTASQNQDIATGLARAAARWPDLRQYVPDTIDISKNSPLNSDQTFQSRFGKDGTPVISPKKDGTSLSHSPADFDVRSTQYEVEQSKQICLVLPCSQTKPYRDSRTHQVVEERLRKAGVWTRVEKVSLSGLYGPVPLRFEDADAVTTYDYVLTDVDKQQISLVKKRLVDFLHEYADQFDAIYGYATSKTYRSTIEDAFDDSDIEGKIVPTDPPARRLTEHFRNIHLDELAEVIQQATQTSKA